jgi:hypothetical protein
VKFKKGSMLRMTIAARAEVKFVTGWASSNEEGVLLVVGILGVIDCNAD